MVAVEEEEEEEEGESPYWGVWKRKVGGARRKPLQRYRERKCMYSRERVIVIVIGTENILEKQ